MQITIKAKKLDLTPALRQYAEEKVGKLARFYDRISVARVDLERRLHREKGDIFRAEINLDVPRRKVIRAEVEANDIYAAIDLVIPKLEKTISRFKEESAHIGFRSKFFPLKRLASIVNFGRNKEKQPRIIERKRFQAVKPMTESEAVLELSRHNRDFYLFWNADTDRFAVIYKRGDGDYNLVEPELP